MKKEKLIKKLEKLGSDLKNFIEKNKSLEKYQLIDILDNNKIKNYNLLYYNNKFNIDIFDYNDYNIELIVKINEIVIEVLTSDNEPVKLIEL